MDIRLTCKECGSTAIAYDEAEGDASLVTCAGCDEVYGTMADVREQARAVAISDARKKLRSHFKG